MKTSTTTTKNTFTVNFFAKKIEGTNWRSYDVV